MLQAVVIGPMRRTFIRAMSGMNTRVYRASGGRLMGRMGKAPVLLLTTTGRRSGQPRVAPLLYVEQGGSYAVVASYGGSDTHPAWFLNLEAQPAAEIEVGKRRLGVKARVADGDERARLWSQLAAIYPAYDKYEKQTTRRIPVVVLDPA